MKDFETDKRDKRAVFVESRAPRAHPSESSDAVEFGPLVFFQLPDRKRVVTQIVLAPKNYVLLSQT